MRRIVGFTFVVAIYFLVTGSSGIKCYSGIKKEHKIVDCKGSCYYIDRPGKFTELGCVQDRHAKHCETHFFKVTCYCNTGECNWPWSALKFQNLRFQM